jgi:hypothetical protein
MNILIAIILVLAIGFVAAEYSLMSSRFSDYKSYLVAIENVSEQYALLYQSYSVAFKKYLVTAFPDESTNIKGIPAA